MPVCKLKEHLLQLFSFCCCPQFEQNSEFGGKGFWQPKQMLSALIKPVPQLTQRLAFLSLSVPQEGHASYGSPQ